MRTFIISQDKKEVKRFTNQESDFAACKYIQSHQSQSLNWALRYGGWQVEEIDEETEVSTWWNP